MDLQLVGWGTMDWIDLAQERDWRQAFVNAVMNPRFYKILGISWQSEGLLTSQKGLWSMKSVSYNVYNVVYVAFEHYVEF